MRLLKFTLLTIFMLAHAILTAYGYVKGFQVISKSGEVSYILMMLVISGILIACLLYLITKFE